MSFSAEAKGKQVWLSVPRELTMRFSMLFPKFEGSKRIIGDGVFSFEPTGANVKMIIERFSDAEACLSAFVEKPKPRSKFRQVMEFKPKLDPWNYQQAFYDKQRGKPVFALFAEVGAGKTKMGIDTSFEMYCNGEIDGVIIIANKGVHEQWILDALPEHAPDNVPWIGYTHDLHNEPDLKANRLKFFAMNFDAAKTSKNVEKLSRFISSCDKVRIIIDESQNISNKSSQRWGAIWDVREKCISCLIMSGTPIVKDLVNYWAQYFMLDENIIGDRYLSSFKGKYCRLGGWDGRQVVGYQNEVNLFKLTEPFTFRINADDLALPPKRRKQIVFSMPAEMREAYTSFKENFVRDLNDPNSSAVANAAGSIIRLQQITSGYLPEEDGTIYEFENARLNCLMQTLGTMSGKVMIWCRFKYDVKAVAAALGEKCVTYYGETDSHERDVAKFRFINDPEVLYIVGTAGAMGTGIDGFQTVCNQNIYYSNTFKATDRWQSEGRTNRKGMEFDSTLYIDLICRGGLDRKILKRLQDKRNLSDMMLDDIRWLVENDKV